ncbi:MAG: RseA family anti-sigma factor [Aeromonas molluscorum]|jgi:sigma-E factor negative regulatory protein RseA
MANKQQISALMDGDLSDVQELDFLAMDAESCDTWSRYHLIGDAMRGDLPLNLQLDLSDKIALALDDEPTILAPIAAPAQPVRQPGRVIPFLRRAGQQFGQYAIAASVAAAVIFGVQQYQGQDPAMQTNPVLNTIPVGGSASPVSVHYAQDGERTSRQQTLNEQQMNEQRARINAFLRDHQLQQRLLQDKQVQE